MTLFEKIKCPVCSSKKFIILRKNQYKIISQKKIKKFYLSSSNQILLDQLVKCNNCKLIYLNPRVNSKIIASSYKKNSDKEFVKYNKFRLKTFSVNLIRVLKIINFENKSNFRILDVGSGGGTFLLAAKKLGFKVEGIEPNKWLVRFTKNKNKLKIKQGTLETIRFNYKFDLICFWDVFEHVTDLNATLRICKKILNKNGTLLINVPDYGSIFRKILGFKWPFFLNVHLYYFEKETLIKLFKKYNFSFQRKMMHIQLLPIKYILSRAANYFQIFNFIKKILPSQFDFGIWYNIGQSIYVFKNDSIKIKN